MNVYEFTKSQMSDANFFVSLKSGLISTAVVNRLVYYETFLKYRKEGKNITTAEQLAADDCLLNSTVSIYNARKFFERKLSEI